MKEEEKTLFADLILIREQILRQAETLYILMTDYRIYPLSPKFLVFLQSIITSTFTFTPM